MDERCALEFFDFFHPKISDPGAYVTVHREDDGLQFQLGNHGWSSAWQPITRDALVDYIHKNREHNEGRLFLKARYKESRMVKTKTGTSQTSYYFDIRDKK
ncbi:hypothetical protein [Hyalangium sp.]|uniref:hypothetical protein n=1 Tax=Hyalangium sp. TaxID=2028555 RepID=UPI002D7317DC|nr:hypothetical protein [Hyalangium sp.]HYI01282.1 hypothetical protein [Hyalangium sp.]